LENNKCQKLCIGEALIQLRKKYWGRHLWARGYFNASVGAVTEDQIKQYIEDQSDAPDPFRVWDEAEQEKTDLESDSSE